MKGIFKGFEPLDYFSTKKNHQVKGCTLYFDVKSGDVFGCVGKNEYLSADTPIYNRSIAPIMEQLCDETSPYYGGTIEIDYNVDKRNNMTFTSIASLVITPKPQEQKAVK